MLLEMTHSYHEIYIRSRKWEVGKTAILYVKIKRRINLFLLIFLNISKSKPEKEEIFKIVVSNRDDKLTIRNI